MQNPIKITDGVKEATKSLIISVTLLELIYPKVRTYQKAILKELKGKNKYTGETIGNPIFYYLLDEESLYVYLTRCDEEADKLGILHESKQCPVIKAQRLELIAKKQFFKAVKHYLPQYKDISFNDLYANSKDKSGNYRTDKLGRYLYKYDEFIELTLPLIISQIDPKELEIRNLVL